MQKILRALKRGVYVVFVYVVAFVLQDWSGSKKNGNTEGKEDANSPSDLSGSAWKRTLKETKQALKDKDLATTAAGLAYYATLTFFPAALGLATLFIVFSSPQQLLSVIQNLNHYLPPAIAKLVSTQLSPVASSSNSKVGIAAFVSILALLWTTSGGLQNLVKATNKAYDVQESRNLIKLRLVSIGLSAFMLAVGAIIIVLLVLQASALRQLGFPNLLATLFPFLRWPVLVVLISLLLSAIYRYAPDRKEPRWQWVSWGATAATIIWLLVSALFFFYVQNFANFNKSYGSLAGIVVLMIWFNYSALIILIGAQVNKRLEVNTTKSADPSK